MPLETLPPELWLEILDNGFSWNDFQAFRQASPRLLHFFSLENKLVQRKFAMLPEVARRVADLAGEMFEETAEDDSHRFMWRVFEVAGIKVRHAQGEEEEDSMSVDEDLPNTTISGSDLEDKGGNNSGMEDTATAISTWEERQKVIERRTTIATLKASTSHFFRYRNLLYGPIAILIANEPRFNRDSKGLYEAMLKSRYISHEIRVKILNPPPFTGGTDLEYWRSQMWEYTSNRNLYIGEGGVLPKLYDIHLFYAELDDAYEFFLSGQPGKIGWSPNNYEVGPRCGFHIYLPSFEKEYIMKHPDAALSKMNRNEYVQWIDADTYREYPGPNSSWRPGNLRRLLGDELKHVLAQVYAEEYTSQMDGFIDKMLNAHSDQDEWLRKTMFAEMGLSDEKVWVDEECWRHLERVVGLTLTVPDTLGWLFELVWFREVAKFF
ncbi:hypothetical protein BJ508DRAFT_329633 [Ascobolus immersus RN42]|uniref:F-box domain-containing protein n=1 Tax=Ascobolus immersus RN42 TaxID=1160509 RepID=A0A3N4HY15_ASCIM|nr:hypothetical protein BJ508DRAFT_329633 [Ascobolus immersus RN42]